MSNDFVTDCRWFNNTTGECSCQKKDRSKQTTVIMGHQVDVTWDGQCVSKEELQNIKNGTVTPPLACDYAEVDESEVKE